MSRNQTQPAGGRGRRAGGGERPIGMIDEITGPVGGRDVEWG